MDLASYVEPDDATLDLEISQFIESSSNSEGGKKAEIKEQSTDEKSSEKSTTSFFGKPLSRNSTSFINKLTVKLHQLHEEFLRLKRTHEDLSPGRRNSPNKAENRLVLALKYHQWLVVQWMSSYEFPVREARGLLCYHDMGTGKTRVGAATALTLMDIGIYPIFIAPKSLQNNMMETIADVLRITRPGISDAEIVSIQKRFVVASSDAYNMFEQVSKTGTLDGRVILIDEAHDFVRAIVNSGNDETNARKLYNAIMNAKNVRVLFLTGSPMVKNVFEIVPLANMIAGTEILPIQYDVFMDLYVDLPNRKIKNRDKLQNRLFGMVSYISTHLPLEPDSGAKILKPRDDGYFPELLPMKVVHVEMSESQYKAYLLAREKEELELSGRGRSGDSPQPCGRLRGESGTADRHRRQSLRRRRRSR